MIFLTDIKSELNTELRTEAFARAMMGKVENLLTLPDKNTKIKKSLGVGVYTGMLSLAAGNQSGINVCPWMTKGCQKACLYKAGCGIMQNVQIGRLRRTYQFFFRRAEFLAQLIKEISSIERKSKKLGMIAAIRLNGTSDIAWENETINGKNIFELFPTVQFYDYTKGYKRLALSDKYSNVHMTYSRAETKKSNAEALKALKNGYPVTVVFQDKLPETWQGYPVVDGDKHDYRVWDSGCVVGLILKGHDAERNAAIDSGFAVCG